MGVIKSNSAVSTVVGAILILAVIITIISVVNAYFIPSWKTELEINHLSEVQQNFLKLQSVINAHVLIDTNAKTSIQIILGGGDLPILSSVRSGGTIMVKPDAGYINITVINATIIEPRMGIPSINDNITSVSSLILRIDNTTTEKMYTACINGDFNKSINVSIENVNISTKTSDIRVITREDDKKFNEVIDTVNSNNFYSLDLLNPIYGFDNVLENVTPPFNLKITDGKYYIRYEEMVIIERLNSSIRTGVIKYSSTNNFWIDQSFIYENDAVIMDQNGVQIMKSNPSFIYDNATGTLSIHAISIATIDNESKFISGNGVQEIQVYKIKGERALNILDVEGVTIEIVTAYPNVWCDYLNGLDTTMNVTIENDTVIGNVTGVKLNVDATVICTELI